jgi:hypothetical protein
VQPQPTSTLQPEVDDTVDESGSGFTNLNWLLVALAGLGALAALAAFAALRRSRAARFEESEEETAQPVQAAAPAPVPARPAVPAAAPRATPQPAPQMAPVAAKASNNGVVGIQIRPWLNLEFRPAQAAATLTEAVVQYELVITNTGNAAARNVRVEAKMFNAGADQDKEISEFFARPAPQQGRSRILAIPPRSGARMRSSVAMPKENVREITVEGRRLFIPMVAINVVYEWGEGRSGQTSMSYLVGREPERPSTKMGAFRLDLGPRIYRSVGQRPSNVAVLV